MLKYYLLTNKTVLFSINTCVYINTLTKTCLMFYHIRKRLNIWNWNIGTRDTSVFSRDVLWYGDVRPGLRPSDSSSVRVSVRPFSALFSYMLWQIDLKFCTWLCFDVLQIKFDCRHFVSIFEGVMPLCELRILVMCSFPHFSPTCFDIFEAEYCLFGGRRRVAVARYRMICLVLIELKFCIWLCFTYYLSSLSVVNLRQ